MGLPAKVEERQVSKVYNIQTKERIEPDTNQEEKARKKAEKMVKTMIREAVNDTLDSRDALNPKGMYRFNIFDPANAKARRSIGMGMTAIIGFLAFAAIYDIALAHAGALGMLMLSASAMLTVYFKVIKKRNVMWYQEISNITKRPVNVLEDTRATSNDMAKLLRHYRTIGDILNGGRDQFLEKGFSKKLVADLDVMFEDLGYAPQWEE